jgi:hypothetical protein
MQRLAWFSFRRLLLFALAGPPLGLVFSGIIDIGGLVRTADPVEALASVRVLALLLAWAYLLGVVPATFTGLAVPALLRSSPAALRGRLWVQILATFVVGALATGLFFLSFPFNTAYFALIGGCSAAGCALLARLLRVGNRSGHSGACSPSN